MSIVVEDGTGVNGAESYATVAFVDAYWAARTNDANAAIWTGLGTPAKEGALRSATDYLERVYGPNYVGVRKGYVQGLLWPRTKTKDDVGYPLPDLPVELQKAVAELAVRAGSAALAPDVDQTGMIKRETKKVGPLEKTIEYATPTGPASLGKQYGTVDGLMALLVKTGRGASESSAWAWR